jgi:hypothetical protein
VAFSSRREHMANISITTACNRDCAFCFAGVKENGPGQPGEHMPLPVFAAALDFLERSGIPEVRLLGGEPTLHPDFGRIVDMVVSRGLSLVLFSGGLIPESALVKLESLPVFATSLLLNAAAPLPGRPLEPFRLEEVCRRLGARVMLGVTIDSPAIRLEPILDAIERHGLRRSVRLGLAQPSPLAANTYLHPRHYPEVGRRVAEFAVRARERSIGLEFDCGWVPCMFPEGALAALGRGAEGLGERCGPVPDLLPVGRFISCYPLAALGSMALHPALDARAARDYFRQRREQMGPCFLGPDCDGCAWMAGGACGGGCLSVGLLRRRNSGSPVMARHGAHGGD